MRICLLFLSIFLPLIVVNAQIGIPAEQSAMTSRFTLDISMSKGHLSGILIAKNQEDTIIGTMVNEFGVTALSFVYEKKSHRIKLHDVIGFLNKWYIKRVLRSDIKYCLHILYGTPAKEKRYYIVSRNDNEIILTNTKRQITYTFSPIQEQNVNDQQHVGRCCENNSITPKIQECSD
ncbi:MAG: hypothetical protein NC082_03135 [Clostridiales bacterium]|nr:hypothetical protein [Clostridiales bacterium]